MTGTICGVSARFTRSSIQPSRIFVPRCFHGSRRTDVVEAFRCGEFGLCAATCRLACRSDQLGILRAGSADRAALKEAEAACGGLVMARVQLAAIQNGLMADGSSTCLSPGNSVER